MKNKTESIWFSGKLVPWDDAKVHVLTHTLHYSGGTFEGIRCYKSDQGTAIFKLPEHVDRLLYSANALKMPVPFNREQILNAIIEVVRVNKLEEGYIRPLMFYGYGKMGVSPIGNPVELIIACWPWGAYLSHDAIDIKTSSFTRIDPNSTVVDAKLCGHYLNSLLASIELQGTHYHEALFLDNKGFVAEGVGENFFIIKDNIIYTPNLGDILPGITRATVMKLANQLGFKLIEKDIILDEAYAADEAFFTGTAAEVTPIRSIDDKVLGEGKTGPVTAKIRAAYLDLVRGKNSEWTEHLSFV